MATYKGIQGYSVQNLSSDPGTLADVVGQLWYNSTSGKFKIAVQSAGAWASGTSLLAAKQAPGGAGTQTAAIAFGGLLTPAVTANTESFNGSTWTEVANLGTGRYDGGSAGTQTAALGYAGTVFPSTPTALTEEWDGTSWTAKTAMTTARNGLASFGISTAAVGAGGAAPPAQTAVEEWNGSAWSEGTNLSVARKNCGGFGILTGGVITGGRRASPEAGWVGTEEYDGTSWTEGGDLNTGSFQLTTTGKTQTAGLIFARNIGGYPGPTVTSQKTEEYNGTAWTEVADMGDAARFWGSMNIGPSTAALCAGGGLGGGAGPTAIMEEWSGAPITAKVVTVS